MKILIRGAGFENKGAEAMLRVVQRELGKRIEGVSFYVAASPLEEPFAYKAGFIPLNYKPSSRMQLLRSFPFVYKIPEYILSARNPDFARAIKTNRNVAYEINQIKSVDAVIDISGFAYSDSCSWGYAAAKSAWAWIEFCAEKKRPYIILPQAFGPFESPQIASLSKKIFNSAALTFSRDVESSKYLSKLQGIAESDVRQGSDIAFCFQGASPIAGKSIIKNLGFDLDQQDRPLIALVPNMRVYERTKGTGTSNSYLRLLVAIADYCINTIGANLLIIPNEISVPGASKPDDRYLCSLIELLIQNPEQCIVVREYYSSEIVKSILANATFLVASRFHSLVFALSQGVPTIALGWSHKYIELLRFFGLQDFVIDHDKLDSKTVIDLLEKAWQQKECNRKIIIDALPTLVNKSQTLFDEVAAVIRKENH